MSFASLWPLAFIAAIPVIVILYILKPRGNDVVVSSNLLWKKIFKNQQSRTFFEKFIHELLMYLQIAAMMFLILSLMAPFIMTNSVLNASTCVVIDNSFSMSHVNGNGKTRLEEAKKQAKEYISSAGGNVTLISYSDSAKILVSATGDRNVLRAAIDAIQPEDTEADMTDITGMIESVGADRVVVYTDGYGCTALSQYASSLKADVYDMGEKSANVSLDYVYAGKNDGRNEVSVRITDYSEFPVSLDISIYGDDGKLLGVKSVDAESGKSASVLFDDVLNDGRYYKAELSGIRFGDGNTKDSLSADNISYAVNDDEKNAKGMLIGSGNTFIERAFYACTGNDLVRSESDNAVVAQGANMAVYDAGYGRAETKVNSLEFMAEGSAGRLSHMNISVKKDTELTEGLSDFKIGANEVLYYDCPEWAESFMEADGKCVGYYGIDEGVKRVVLGFDIRESDFALKAEFPVFMAETVSYLSDLGMLSRNLYEAGESIELNPQPEYIQMTGIPDGKLIKAGIFSVKAGERTEYYCVTAPLAGRDGRIISEDLVSGGIGAEVMAKKSIRNIFLILAIVLLVVEWIFYVRRMNYRKKFYLISRALLLLLIILAMLGIRIPKIAKNTTTIFLVDTSVSDELNIKTFEKYIDESLQKMPKGNKYGIVTFGRDTAIDQFVTDKDMFMGIKAVNDTTATDFEKALQRAVSMIPDDSVGRIVLLTDGEETSGDIENAASMIKASNISLEAYELSSETGDDCYVESVDMPKILHPGDKYYMTVALESNYETDAVISVISDEKVVTEERVHLRKGHNEFVFEENVTGSALEVFEVKVSAEGDTCEENNSVNAYAEVTDAPKVLIIRNRSERGEAFDSMLENINASAVVVKPSEAPETLNELLEYRAVILENAYKEELSPKFMDVIETYVKDYGRGFIMTGGEDSFMLGGYNETSIEKILPVNMELRNDVEVPKTAIVMVIDHSGSMDSYAGNGVTYLDIAIEAAKRGVDNLRDTDEIGVIAFDDQFEWYHEISDASDKDGVKSDIDDIPSGGGTVIMPSVEEAREKLRGSDAAIKHIILLTDGCGETQDFKPVTDKINDDGVTLSTVAVGSGADVRLMMNMAAACGGRYYYADFNTDIPRIFAREVFLGGNTYIKNGDYNLSIANGEITNNLFPDGWPNILGYVAASPKSSATQLIVSNEGDPILTVWQYGLGKTIAWNTDVSGAWTSGYSGENDYAELWKRMLDYACGANTIGEDRVDVKSENGHTVLEYHTDEYDDGTGVEAVYSRPDGEVGEVTLSPSKPGVYTAVVESDKPGIYNFNIRRSDNGEVTGALTTASAVQYSDEYRFDVTDEKFRFFIDKYGSWVDPEENIWKKLNTNAMGRYDLTNLFLVLAVLLFIADIAGRRFGFDPDFRSLKKEKKKAGMGQPVQEMAGDAVISQTPQIFDPGAGAVMPNAPEANASAATANAARNKAKPAKKQEAPADDNLDTAALLKKMRDRNNR